MSKESKSKEAERAMMGRIFFEKKWDDLRKIYGRQGEVTSTGGSTENNAPGCSLRRETSPGGTVREFYADGSEKEPDVSTAEPVGLGRRIVLGYARRAPVESLVNMHQMYRAESARLNGAFEVNDSTPQAEFLNRAGLKALPEEDLKTTAQLASLIPTDHPDISTRAQQLFENFYREYGMPNDGEKCMLAEFGRVQFREVHFWFRDKHRRMQPHRDLLKYTGISR